MVIVGEVYNRKGKCMGKIINKLAPSMLAIDFGHMEDELKIAVDAGMKILHVDVMDGYFVPNISFGPPVIKYVKQAIPDTFLDVHMMVVNPSRYFAKFLNLGASNITIHAEATEHLREDLLNLKSMGINASVAISPDTPISDIEDVLDVVDMVLIMSVYPGFGGQEFIPGTFDRLKALKAIRDERGLSFDIEVDGGVTKDNVKEILDAGANVIVAGSAVFSGDTAQNIRDLLASF
ncbi:ribulose-phosphate 3-epimerase [Lachnospiraceae bacterium NE2001]|nr:ribulose-phosphate 3-epimerase [Lachnospiraceae bacterium NE2001]